MLSTGQYDKERAETLVMDIIEWARGTVLEDFDAVCAADAFMGFTDAEFAAIKKFFSFNNSIRKS